MIKVEGGWSTELEEGNNFVLAGIDVDAFWDHIRKIN